MIKKRLFFICSLACLLAGLWQSSFAAESLQDERIRISGTVIDENRDPIPGVTVTLKGTGNTVVTNNKGNFYVEVPSQRSILEFQTLGYFPKEVTVGEDIYLEVPLDPDIATLDEIVVTGYGDQRRLSIIGAVATLPPSDLQIGSSRTMSNILGGQVAGIITSRSRGGEPGYDESDFWIRGIATLNSANSKPLVLIDGIERDLNVINPAEIESFSVLKDASASAMYGVRGANGVIVITTKRGQIGPPKVDIRVEHSVLTPTKLPKFVGAAEHMTLLNELAPGTFSDLQIERTRTGYDPDIYPDVNWIDAISKDFASTTQANLTVSGGSNFLRYALVASYFNEQGIVERDWSLPYTTSIGQNQYNMRANVDLDLTKTTTLRMNIGGYLRQRRSPTASIDDVFAYAFEATSFSHPARYSDGTIPVVAGRANAWAAATQSGHKTDSYSEIQSLFSLEQDLKMITKGLKAKAVFSFDSYSEGTVARGRTPQYWGVATARDLYGNLQHGIISASDEALGRHHEGRYGNKRVYFEGTLNYDRSFGAHDVSALFLYNQQSYEEPGKDGGYGALQPYRKQGIAGRLSYTYDSRYVAEFNFGYNGSENFAKGQRFGFFPSVAMGWLLSEEPFMKNAKHILSKFKLRASAGMAGNDNIGYNRRFAYLTTINYDGEYGWGGSNRGGITEGDIGVSNLTWETTWKYDAGLEISLWNALDLQVDIFQEDRSNIFIQRQLIPNQAGFATRPFANYGKVQNKGFEFSLEYRKRFNQDWMVSLRGNFTYARNKVIEKDEPESYKGTYRSYTGRSATAAAALIAERLFTEDDFIGVDGNGIWTLKPEIPRHDVGTSNVMPGDIKYADMNGDGVITMNDVAVLDDVNLDDANRKAIPRAVYGFGGSLKYKNVDFSFFFYGVGDVNRIIGLSSTFIPGSGKLVQGNVYSNYQDRWTAENPSQDVFWPNLAHSSNVHNAQASTWWKKDMSFLRLKSIEIGYSFNPNWIKKAGMSGLRIYVSGNDLFQFSKFKLWDPEVQSATGLRYPTMKSVLFGLNLSF